MRLFKSDFKWGMFEFHKVLMIIRGKVFLTVRNGFKLSSITKMIEKIILIENPVFISSKVILTDKNDYSQIFFPKPLSRNQLFS